MQDWRADSFYEFGDTVSLKSSLYFCLAFKTENHPSEVSDWLKIHEVHLTLPQESTCETVILLEPSEKCFIFTNSWEEVSFKKNLPIAFSNRNPKENEEGLFWVNEVDGLIFKNESGWKVINGGDEEIVENPFKPSKLDDENDTSGNGVITEGVVWLDSKHNKVYVNVDASYKNSIWKKI